MSRNSGFEFSSKLVLSRMLNRMDAFSPNSPEYKRALFHVGTVVRNIAMENLTRQGAISSGQLRARMAFRIEGNADVQRVLIGAFGVRYARMVEQGGAFTDAMRRAMFASFRERGLPPRQGKGVITGNRYRARPYLAPALRQARATIVKLLREALIQSKGGK